MRGDDALMTRQEPMTDPGRRGRASTKPDRPAARTGSPSDRDAPRLPADPSTAGPLPAAAGAPAPRASLALVAGFGILVACLVVLGSIAETLREGELYLMDQAATPFLHAHSSPALDAIMNALTTLGSTAVAVPLFVVAVVVLTVRHRPGSALFVAVAAGGSLLLNEVMKLYFHRPRPGVPWAHVLPDPSFPSGHTMNGLALLLSLAIVIWSALGPKAGILAVAAAIVLDIGIAVSRVYLGYHYVTDVTGGFLAGIAWVLVAIAAFRWRAIGPFRRRRPQAEPSAADGPRAA
jgi:undecaprenyl-diphosphatase